MQPSEPLVIERLVGDGGVQEVLRLNGPLTFENVSPFQNAMRAKGAPTMILDLEGVPYVDSAGLGSLVGACVSVQKSGRRVALTGLNDRVMRLFEITRTEPLFLIFPTLEDAIEGLTHSGQA